MPIVTGDTYCSTLFSIAYLNIALGAWARLRELSTKDEFLRFLKSSIYRFMVAYDIDKYHFACSMVALTKGTILIKANNTTKTKIVSAGVVFDQHLQQIIERYQYGIGQALHTMHCTNKLKRLYLCDADDALPGSDSLILFSNDLAWKS